MGTPVQAPLGWRVPTPWVLVTTLLQLAVMIRMNSPRLGPRQLTTLPRVLLGAPLSCATTAGPAAMLLMPSRELSLPTLPTLVALTTILTVYFPDRVV